MTIATEVGLLQSLNLQQVFWRRASCSHAMRLVLVTRSRVECFRVLELDNDACRKTRNGPVCRSLTLRDCRARLGSFALVILQFSSFIVLKERQLDTP